MSKTSAPPTMSSSATVFESFVKCNASFATLVEALSEADSRPTRLGQVNIESLLEQLGRLKIWGDQSKADFPSRARGSLDDTLRRDKDLRDMVVGILQRLNTLLDMAIPIAKKKFDDRGGSDQDSVSSVSDDDSDQEDDDAESSGETARRTVPKIAFYARLIFAQIRSLYEISALLRRPTVATKYIRSVKKAGKMSQDPGNMRIQAFITYEYRQITEKVRQWRGQTKYSQEWDEDEASREADLEADLAATQEAGQRESADIIQECNDIRWLCERLVEANMRRREQIEYWVGHPYDPSRDQLETAPLATQLPVSTAFTAEQGEDAAKLPAVTGDLGPTKAVTLRGSEFSKQSFSIAPMSELFDTETSGRPRTDYTPTEAGQKERTSVPNPPKLPGDSDTFPCPYCGTTLGAKVSRNRKSWKQHVFRDLRPYICSFEHCSSGSQLFLTRNDWIYHELQVHRRRFICHHCNTNCPDRPSMYEHLRQHYRDDLGSDRLSIVLELCNHQAEETDEDTCVICGRELALSDLHAHLAGHMEEIALFALPMTYYEDESGGERDSYGSQKVAGPAAPSLTNIGKMEDSGGDGDNGSEPLTFEDAHPKPSNEDHKQTADNFEKLRMLRGDDDGETRARVSDWVADSEVVADAEVHTATTIGEEYGIAPDSGKYMPLKSARIYKAGIGLWGQKIEDANGRLVMEKNKLRYAMDRLQTRSYDISAKKDKVEAEISIEIIYQEKEYYSKELEAERLKKEYGEKDDRVISAVQEAKKAKTRWEPVKPFRENFGDRKNRVKSIKGD